MQAISPPSPKSHKWICLKHNWTFTNVRRLFDRTPTINDQIVSVPILTPTMEKFQFSIRINIHQWINQNFRIFLDINTDDDDVDGEEMFQKYDPEFKYSWMVFDNHGNPYNIRDWGLVSYGDQFTIVTTIYYKTRHGFWFPKYEGLDNYRFKMLTRSGTKSNNYSQSEANPYNDDDIDSDHDDEPVDCVVFVDDYYGLRSSASSFNEWEADDDDDDDDMDIVDDASQQDYQSNDSEAHLKSAAGDDYTQKKRFKK